MLPLSSSVRQMTDPATTESLKDHARRTEITCKARYHAARRLNSHSWFSQWTLSLLAVGQIALSVAEAIGLPIQIGPKWFSLGSIFFSVLILAYSLLLGMSNVSARAERIHDCGLELGRLARKLYAAQRSASVKASEYNELSSRYYNILEKHENHTRTDYLVAHNEYYEALQTNSSSELVSALHRFWLRTEVRILHVIQFSHYIVSLLLMASFGYVALA